MTLLRIRNLSFFLPVLLSALLSLVAGCAQIQEVGTALGKSAAEFSKSINGSFSGGSFPESNPADSCNVRVQALKADYEYFQQPLVARAASARINDFFLSILSGRSVNDAVSAAMQGFTQDLVNASLGQATKDYLGTVGEENNGNYRSIFRRVSSDAGNDSKRLDNVRNKISRLESCRKQQINNITRDYKRKRITAVQARQDARQVQSWVRRDNQLIEKIVGQSGERVNVYVEADQYVAKKRSAKKSTNVAKANRSHKKVKQEQQQVAKLDQTIEQEIEGFA
ncbi:MAG: hypothetical protein R3F53_26775 [Gammaproteobacteria bacterium]